MDIRGRLRGQRGLTVLATAGTAIVVAGFAAMVLMGRPAEMYYELFLFHNGPVAIAMLWMAWLVLRRHPRHGAGLVMLAVGLLSAAHVGVAVLLDARMLDVGLDVALLPDYVVVPAELPVDIAVVHLLLATLWVPTTVPIFTLLPLLFPDGRLPSRRWRWVAVAAAAGTALTVLGFAVLTWPTVGRDEPTLAGLSVDEVLVVPGLLLVLVAAVASVISLVLRWRGTAAGQRWQFRAVGTAVVVLVVIGTVTYPWQQVWIPATLVASVALVLMYGLAVARYRLHDLEPVLGRAAVGAILAGLVAVVYLVVVVGAGALVGRGVENTWLPLVAVGVVALLVEPVRRRARRWVDRWLYGRDADRAEVLSVLAARASAAVDADEILDEVADLLVRSTGAARAEVWLAVEPQPHWPPRPG